MEVHLQKCQKCRSTTVNNLLVRSPGQPQTVYVKCDSCGEFVAQYRLGDYFHYGKGIESWLRSQGSAVSDSGRDFLGAFERVKETAIEGFKAAAAKMEEQIRAAREKAQSESSQMELPE